MGGSGGRLVRIYAGAGTVSSPAPAHQLLVPELGSWPDLSALLSPFPIQPFQRAAGRRTVPSDTFQLQRGSSLDRLGGAAGKSDGSQLNSRTAVRPITAAIGLASEAPR